MSKARIGGVVRRLRDMRQFETRFERLFYRDADQCWRLPFFKVRCGTLLSVPGRT
jgi:hypothetical protein